MKHYSKIGYNLCSYHTISTMSQLCFFSQNDVKLDTFGTDRHLECWLVCLDQPQTPDCANLLFCIPSTQARKSSQPLHYGCGNTCRATTTKQNMDKCHVSTDSNQHNNNTRHINTLSRAVALFMGSMKSN